MVTSLPSDAADARHGDGVFQCFLPQCGYTGAPPRVSKLLHAARHLGRVHRRGRHRAREITRGRGGVGYGVHGRGVL